ncbi:hydratase [Mesorhizobium sp. LHD-90]|uniref:2-keto-4-pentenoate hydratase n=1 Tax=Mesorhizobium sp. LHD-90 TaxID=3071414 RepID=UPI0027E03666|nr:hydratase [Mesorhizobium sp. LHD-90]MDQ6433328.1 hydratase [Mesorhizobium sp. LHD-90]
MANPSSIETVARETFAFFATGNQTEPISSSWPGFDLPEAYEVAALIADLRRARGETTVGRKIGFTNRAVWQGYGISGPIWAYMFDTTVHELAQVGWTFSLNGLPEPRIEPEIVLHLASKPESGMSEEELVECVDWVAHAFEIVFSIFPGWNFSAADAAAAFGVHAALLLGDRHRIDGHPEHRLRVLSDLAVDLIGGHGIRVHGQGSNVLGGPVKALQFLVSELARFPKCEPVGAGELVTTGTLTQAMSVRPGEQWSTILANTDLAGLRLTLSD